MKTIKKIIQKQRINERNNEIPILIATAIKKEKEFIFSHPEYKLSFFEYLKLKLFFIKLKNNYPLAYITKNKEFFNLDFIINKNVLVPRPETEVMVESAIDLINKKNKEKILLIDVGTGSGCIPISILKNINKKIKTVAIDVSKGALILAKENAEKHNVIIEFFHDNLLKPVMKKKMVQNYTDIIITANLPYITEKQFQGEPSIKKEPKIALVADKHGLDLYIQLLRQISTILKTKSGLSLQILLEIDPSQTKMISKIIKKYLPKNKIGIIKDLAQKDRVIKIF